MQPLSTRMVSPLSSFSMTVPPAWTKARPSPCRRCRMKPSPPKRPAPKRLVKAMLMPVPRAAHRKASFWHSSSPPRAARSMGTILPGIGGGEGHALLAGAAVAEMGHEDRFAADGALGRREQLVHQSRLGPRAVTELGLEGDAVIHPVHDAGFGHHRLAGVQFDLHHLHVVAEDLITDFMGFHSAPPCAHGRHLQKENGRRPPSSPNIIIPQRR